MKMCLDDFKELTPDEFGHIFNSYKEAEEAGYKSDWERMRLLATITAQPHSKKRLTPEALIPLPWDKGKTQKAGEFVTAEESRRRFLQLVERNKERSKNG